jgi:hypothetical protein
MLRGDSPHVVRWDYCLLERKRRRNLGGFFNCSKPHRRLP